MSIIRISKKFLLILSKHQKIRIAEMFVLMVIAGIMEMLSVSLILPFIEAVMDADAVMQRDTVHKVCSILKIESSWGFLIFMALVMAVLYIVKNLFLLFQLTVQNRFVNYNMCNIQERLLKSFLNRPYEFFLEVKSGEILRIVGDDTQRGFGILTMLLSFFSEFVVTGALLITVFIISPVVTLAMGGVLLVISLAIQVVIRPILKRAGDEYTTTQASKSQWLLQAIQGIKEIKLMRREGYFQGQYGKNGKRYARVNYVYQTLAVVPRYMIEAVAMSTFFVVIATMIYFGTDLNKLIPVLSGLAVAAIRLLPAVNKISNSLAGIAFGEAAVDKLIENLRDTAAYQQQKRPESDDKVTSANIGQITKEIVMDAVDYQYSTGASKVLDNADMTISKGMSVGIVGASGAGKTTAVDVLLGLLKPQDGRILVDGTDIETDMNGWLSNIGYIPQSIFMLDGNIRENVAFGIDEDKIDDDAVWAALKEAAIDEFVRSLPEGLDTQIGERGMRVSGGQRQRLGIARALYSDPSVLVFDEATSALDNDTEAAIMDSINHLRGTKTIIIIAHRLSTIEGCDMVYRVENGKISRER